MGVRRKVMVFLLSAVLGLGIFPTNALAAGDCGCSDVPLSGSGTSADPYLVATEAELAHVGQHLDAYIKLTGDIALTAAWVPLGTESQPFTGDFNGDNCKITGLQVAPAQYAGLFGVVGAGANLYDFTLEGELSVGPDVAAAGSVAGRLGGTVKAVTSKVNIAIEAGGGQVDVGGIAGLSTGMIRESDYTGTIANHRTGGGTVVGAIVGRSRVTPPAGLPTMITAHAGFGVRDSNGDPVLSATHSEAQDNTLDNILDSINHPLKPDAIEVDVKVAPDGKLRLNHGTVTNSDLALEDVFQLLTGKHPRSGELNSHGSVIRFQADVKAPLAEEVIQLARNVGFPLDRLILAGDMPYSYVAQPQVLATIQAAVNEGMDFWMNPNFIAIEGNDGASASFMAGCMGMINNFEGTPTSFKERIQALGLPRFTVNTNYNFVADPTFQAKLEGAGFNVSVWTLNDSASIEAFITRGVYNTTSRLEEIVIVREGLSTGSLFNTYTGSWPEVGSSSAPKGTVGTGGGTITVWTQPPKPKTATEATFTSDDRVEVALLAPWLLLEVRFDGISLNKSLTRDTDYQVYQGAQGGTIVRLTPAGLAKLEEGGATGLILEFTTHLARTPLDAAP